MKMTKKSALAAGAVLALAGLPAHASIFKAADLAGGYMLASADDASAAKKAADAHCGADCAKNLKGMSAAEAKAACGKAVAEHKCGTAKEIKEGKCGGGPEAKCGGKK